MTKARLQTGAAGEQIPCNVLQEQGYRIIEGIIVPDLVNLI